MTTLHILTGPPASGKTTLGAALAKARSAAFLDIDISTERLIRVALQALSMNPDDRDSHRFKELFRSPIYESLFDTARVNLKHIDVVLTGPFTTEFNNPNWLSEVAETIETPCTVQAYYLFCEEREQRERLIERENPRDLGKLSDWETFRRYHTRQSKPLFPHYPIDTTSIEPIDIAKTIDSLFQS